MLTSRPQGDVLKAAEGSVLTCLHRLLLRGPDLDPVVAHPGLVAGLGEDGRAVDDPAAAQVEARAVPRADHGVPLALALLERSAVVAADAGDRAHLAARGAAEQYSRSVYLDPARAVLRQLRLVHYRHELPGAAPFEGVAVDAQAIVVRELAPEVGGRAADGVPR